MLQALMAYAREQLADSEPGFTTREVRWRIELAGDGRFLNVVPLGEGKKGVMLPRCPDMHKMNSGGKAHFLIESAQFLALLFKNNEKPENIEKANVRHSVYVAFFQEAGKTIAGLRPIAAALSDPACLEAIRATLVASQAKPSDWITWNVDGYDPREDAAVQAWWRSWREVSFIRKEDEQNQSTTKRKRHDINDGMLCLLTGECVNPLLRHPQIKGLHSVGGQGPGDVLVGLDKPSYWSYGLANSANAAMSPQSAQLYADGLNRMIKMQSSCLAGYMVVYWFKEQVVQKDDPMALFLGFQSEETIKASAKLEAQRLLSCINSGEKPSLGRNHFYAMTISAAGRVIVRDWQEGPFVKLVANANDWLSHIEIANYLGGGLANNPKLERVVTCVLQPRKLKQNYDAWIKPLGSIRTNLWRAAVNCEAIHYNILVRLIPLLRQHLVGKDINEVLFGSLGMANKHPLDLFLLYTRMGLLRAYFIRKRKGGEDTMSAYLNPEHPEPAYHCGRLLAVLASLQRAALGDVGAGVVQRYYAAASQTPGLQLGRLITNSRNHLGKLNVKLAWWYEQQIAAVMSALGDAIPRILDLEGQGLFALGYYQQLASLRAGKKDGDSDQPQDDQPQSEQGK